MANSKSWLDHVYDGRDFIRDGLDVIDRLAYIMREAGNEKVANELEAASIDIRVGSEKIKNAISGKITGDVNDSQSAIGEVFRALLHPGDE
jgi:hypothetical protein